MHAIPTPLHQFSSLSLPQEDRLRARAGRLKEAYHVMKHPYARANHFWMLLEGASIVAFLRYLNLTPTQRGLSPLSTTFSLWLPRRMSSCSCCSFKRSCNKACSNKSSFESNSRLSCGSKSRFLCGSRSRFLSSSFSSSSQTPLREPPRRGVPHAHTMAAVPVNRFHALAVPLAALARLQEPKWNNLSSS